MTHNIARTACAAALFLSLAAVARAQEQPGCTNARLAGTWGYTETGTVVTPIGTLAAAAVGTYTFDAAGNFSGTQYSSAAGAVGQDEKYGTYTLNADCTGTMDVMIYRGGALTRHSVWAFVLVEKGAEMRAVLRSMALPDGTPLGPILTMSARPLFLGEGRTCTAASVAGEWGYTKSGTLLTPAGNVAYAAVGKLVFGADGTVSGLQDSSTGGVVSRNKLSGTMTVNADCTTTATVGIYNESGATWLRTAVMWLVIDDNERETRGMVTMLTVPNPAGGTMNIPPVVTVNAIKLSANPGNGQ